MKRMLLTAFVLAATLGVGHAQTRTFQFGEGQAGMPGAAPQAAASGARPAHRRVAAPSSRHRHAGHPHARRRHVKPTRNGIYTHS
ncbi:hypothetical protein GQ57_35130 [Burkholderia sp. MSh2]|uniref:Uncharacterized protein n=1 Tax=Burkholderia paludis TaxID=1506587 RepID=A0A6P2I717_9BURK|nr:MULTISPECIES: hypothetical protein [Burkholderia]KEZ01439.1 hypothetical protein GQ57_35130 [Burkholderia sp. MSh2]KFG97348.1 hypothetical protein GQ56_0110935 [Burkholderia paludis]CAB3746482.1 hypothetical protein LMG30113_00205 [Burkholderia paludis]VWB25083.1 hypothetical protein BPA30113_00890 [Burkholderia paludis]